MSYRKGLKRGYRMGPQRRKRELSDIQTAAAVTSANAAKSQVWAAWVGAAVNVLVVITAVWMPMYERWSEDYETALENREQDRRALVGGVSALVEASQMLGSGGLFDKALCERKEPQNAFDRARAKSIAEALIDRNRMLFPNGVKTTIQIRQQATLSRVSMAISSASLTMRMLPSLYGEKGMRYAYCVAAIYEIADQAKTLKRQLLVDYPQVLDPIDQPLWGRKKFDPIILEDQRTFDQNVRKIEIPEYLYEE